MLRRAALLAFAPLFCCSLGCSIDWLPFWPNLDASSVRVYLINDSTTQYVAPNLGLCPQGLANPPHSFLDAPPILAPGEAIGYSMWRIGGAAGLCIGDCPDYMVGLCGWWYGPDSEVANRIDRKFGGQISLQFQCGDTILLRWTDAGAEGGVWSSSVLTAPGNDPPTADFQEIESPPGQTCAL